MQKTISITLPVEIAAALEKRCNECGVRFDDVVAATLLQHFNTHTIDDPGWKLLDQLEQWKNGARGIPKWEDLMPANSAAPEIELTEDEEAEFFGDDQPE